MNQTQKKAVKTKKKISPEQMQEEIRKRAHEISLERHTRGGDSMSDWLEAEQEIKKKYKVT